MNETRRSGAVGEDGGSRLSAAATKPTVDRVPADESNYAKPNRETDRDIRWFIVHVAEREADSTIRWFQNPKSNVSTHHVVDHRTANLTRQVAESNTAWHAGNRSYNRHSVGIEHSGWRNETRFSDELYDVSARLVRWEATRFDFPKRVRRYDIAPCDAMDGEGGIIGHVQVPDPDDCSRRGGANGHTDPGSLWNWGRYEGFVRRYDIESGEHAVVLSENAVHRDTDDSSDTLDVPGGAVGTATGTVSAHRGEQRYELDFDGRPGWVLATDLLYARFDTGSAVETTGESSVRDEPSGTRLATVPEGTAGTVVDGPVDTGGYRWWKVAYEGGETGWSAGYWLR
ncbi:peptidoglycan recognition family protein [Haladaptatus sp. AB643]|uniref:N-acetylmuramoyl-L-alanine amidase n=1 Tax=Haladaptatus sp. AB643 TaxID=2934174 RepID=UPI00209C59EE|nr:peptidoglycan recognition family protein [Haladaptatus sp. AB643]MCO8242721.1 N-acetylmuramoyl-L-alanine amidase [Haladaptatus sp. AB643]